ncbi:Retrovirus-related Pol polyprotein from transposon RE1 [Vitis vinifera]|uniref:Retrovirus-related Pol polyprotein from transposon RE1 n=1 Tax=Vitis vinifera TaxID=29760 RepID=A0A438IT12_VITVI|nr:Retrovirus-related Pol polyprotein from transposon RE1 [Vitis vinifera]
MSQEEHQKKIGSHINVGSNSTGTMAFAVKTDNSKASGGYKGQKKDRPFCTHCNFHCHTIDKCYKIHGYSPGYKPKLRNNYTYSNNNTVVNQVSNQSFSNSTVKTDQLASSVKPNNHHQEAPTVSYSIGDDCSRFTWIFLLKQKSDVGTIIPKFFNMVVTQFNAKIKVFRSDNAPELAFTDFFNDRGVLHQFSCVERPQQNSIVERKHQHLLNVGRALYFQSREFGCLAFASTLTAHRTKFQPRSRVCVLLGYPPGIKAPSLAKVLLRRSMRVSKPPYLKDFHYNLLSHKDLPSCATSYPLSKYLSHGSLSASVKFPHWRAAMKAELDAMELNKTWSVVSLPKGKHSIGCKWIYKVKFKSDGSIERHKAPIVAKGYTQQEGLDFFETFSPVAKLVTVKVLLALATIQKWHLVQLDVNNAFLNGYLFEEVYMDLPLGYGIVLSQRCYTLQLLEDIRYLACKPTSIPMDPKVQLNAHDGVILSNVSQYRRLIGRLLYLTLSPPDITFAVHKLGQFLAQPRLPHLQAVHHLLRCLKFTSDTRKSITGFCNFIGDSLVSWKAKKQTTISQSSTEAEYRALASTTSELVWLHQLLKDFQVPISSPALLFCDNQVAIHLASNPFFHERTKHIEIDCHFVHDKVVDGFIKLIPLRSQHQLADIFTKAWPSSLLFPLLSKMAVKDIHSPS